MEPLPLHIEYLLTRHDCVIVPGLGAFIATEKEAYIDFEAGIIRPRRREISFNSSVVTEDGLLSHSIARRERVSYEEARRILAQLTSKLTFDLDKEGEVSLGMTGKLIKDPEGLINFQPRRSAIVTDILQDIPLASVRPASETDDLAHKTEDDAAEADQDGMRTIRVKADRYVFTVSKRAVHAAATLVTILTIGLSLLLPINHDNEQKASVISLEDFFHHAVRTEALRMYDTASTSIQENDSTDAVKESQVL